MNAEDTVPWIESVASNQEQRSRVMPGAIIDDSMNAGDRTTLEQLPRNNTREPLTTTIYTVNNQVLCPIWIALK